MKALYLLIFLAVTTACVLMYQVYDSQIKNEYYKIHSMVIEIKTVDNIELILNMRIKGKISEDRKEKITNVAKKTMALFSHKNVDLGNAVIRDKVRLMGIPIVSTSLWQKRIKIVCNKEGCSHNPVPVSN